MPYFAAVFARTDEGWVGAEAELAETTGFDDVTDLMREAAVEAAGGPVVLLASEDEWFAVARMDGDEADPRLFLSDSRATSTSEVAALLYAPGGDVPPAGAPMGDDAILDDLGTGAGDLVGLSERALPGDALSTIAERAGFPDEYDGLR